MGQEPNEVNGRLGPLPSATADDIRSQIDDTRADMTETIDAIQARLSPRRLVRDVKETVKEATVDRVVSLSKKAGTTVGTFVRNSSRGPGGLLERFRRNPVPMAIAGIEVAAVILKELKQLRPERTGRPALVKEPTPAVQERHTARNSARFLVIAAGTACLTTWAIWKLRSSSNAPSMNGARPASKL
jgi:Protein of unknown function (DUF3618)